jgi:hypothetical protein
VVAWGVDHGQRQIGKQTGSGEKIEKNMILSLIPFHSLTICMTVLPPPFPLSLDLDATFSVLISVEEEKVARGNQQLDKTRLDNARRT